MTWPLPLPSFYIFTFICVCPCVIVNKLVHTQVKKLTKIKTLRLKTYLQSNAFRRFAPSSRTTWRFLFGTVSHVRFHILWMQVHTQPNTSVTRNADLSQRHDTSGYTQSRTSVHPSLISYVTILSTFYVFSNAFILLPYRHENSCCMLLRFCDIRNQPILHNTGIYIYTYIHIQNKV